MGLQAQVIYIDESYIKAYSHLDASVDAKDLLPSIIQAQDSQIQPILGTDLFNALKTQITAGTVAGNYDLLLNDYERMEKSSFSEIVSPCLISCLIFSSSEASF